MNPSVANHALTLPTRNRRPRQVVENDDFARFTRRIIAAHGRRVADGDVEALRDLTGLSAVLDDAITQAVIGLRRTYGYSWAEIGSRLGITRQAAQQRFGGTA
ncbi:hypothetical protein GCM10010123_18080 [Pilimelia anulata]|uniref:Uncharacterized protein n=1 Tax=Pilimelia anulata TaxID=53371 RepID=A0A8J3F8F9_9ACTN|nr:hypothetical protein [Pilimelia anulata]GGJ88874.1 hypothetical protein GCM10010123_18080 [Pilimelia anulata]